MDLVFACQRDEISLIQDLIGKGYSVDYQNEDGISPLQMASASGQKGVVKFLLSRGADVNLPNHCGWTPLIHSAFHGHEDIALILLQNKADISAQTKLGLTSMSAACCGGHTSCIRLFLEYDPTACLQQLQEKLGLSPIMAAALHGHDDVLRLLIDHNVNINQEESVTKLTALMLAAANGQKSTVQTLVEHTADPNLTNIIYRTALDIASACGKWEVKAFLGDKTITQNLYTEAKTAEREEPVMLAVKQGNVNELHRLLSMDPDACNRFSRITGLSPLMQATIQGQTEVASLLIKSGANIDAQENRKKWTALMFAVFHRKLNIVSLLLDEGANVEIRAFNDCTALDLVWVSDGGSRELIDLFVKCKDNTKGISSSTTCSPVSTTMKTDMKRSFLRRNSGSSSFRAWMSSRFQHLKRSCSSSSLSAASPPASSEVVSDEDEDAVFPPETNSHQEQMLHNTKWLKLSSLHFLQKESNQHNDWRCKQVHPPLLPSPSKWHSPLPKEYLPPLVNTRGQQSCKPVKEFCPSRLVSRYIDLQKQLCAEMSNGEMTSRLSQENGHGLLWRENPANDCGQGSNLASSGEEMQESEPLGEEDDVKHLLHHLSLERYIPQFQAHEIDLEALKGVTEKDLQEIGVHSIGPRQQLLEAISQLQ